LDRPLDCYPDRVCPSHSRYVSINCIRWLPVPGAGLVFGTNRGKLVMLKESLSRLPRDAAPP